MVTEDLSKLSGRIAYILRVYDLSNRALAAIADISPTAIGDILNEKQKSLKTDNLVRISEKLNIALGWIAEGKGDNPIPKELRANLIEKPKETVFPEEIQLRQKIEALQDRLIKEVDVKSEERLKTIDKLEKLYERVLELERENAELKRKIK
jgi:transcriptional regulator with XRE-family HTH domain